MEMQYIPDLSAVLIFLALLILFRWESRENRRRRIFNSILPGYQAPKRRYFFKYPKVSEGAKPEFEMSLKIKIKEIDKEIRRFEVKIKLRHGNYLPLEKISLEDDFAALSIQTLVAKKRRLLEAVQSYNHSIPSAPSAKRHLILHQQKD